MQKSCFFLGEILVDIPCVIRKWPLHILEFDLLFPSRREPIKLDIGSTEYGFVLGYLERNLAF
jgi:hypothetical protein